MIHGFSAEEDFPSEIEEFPSEKEQSLSMKGFGRFSIYFCVRGLVDLDFSSLSKGDRTDLANHISIKLGQSVRDVSCRQSLLYILVRCLEKPNKTIDIVSNLWSEVPAAADIHRLPTHACSWPRQYV